MRCGLPVMLTCAARVKVELHVTISSPVSLKSSPQKPKRKMTAQICRSNSSLGLSRRNLRDLFPSQPLIGRLTASFGLRIPGKYSIRCSAEANQTLRTCKNCKTQFDPSVNHPRACRYHTAHFGALYALGVLTYDGSYMVVVHCISTRSFVYFCWKDL